MSSVSGCLLVAYQNVFDILLLIEGVINMQYGTAWITEYVFDTLFLETTDGNVGTG
jgi:hypothetical protein